MADDKALKYAIVELTTQKHFLNVYDAIGIERLEWEVVSYDRERHVHLDRANAYVPATRCKLLVHHVLSGRAWQPGWKHEVFGGTFHTDGTTLSRLFKVEYDPGADGSYARFPFRVSIAVGPGKRTATGGIALEGKPTTLVQMRLPADDVKGLCLEIRDFLLVHQRDLEQVAAPSSTPAIRSAAGAPTTPTNSSPWVLPSCRPGGGMAAPSTERTLP